MTTFGESAGAEGDERESFVVGRRVDEGKLSDAFQALRDVFRVLTDGRKRDSG